MKPDALTSSAISAPAAQDKPAAPAEAPVKQASIEKTPAERARAERKATRANTHSLELRHILALEQIADELTLIREQAGVIASPAPSGAPK